MLAARAAVLAECLVAAAATIALALSSAPIPASVSVPTVAPLPTVAPTPTPTPTIAPAPATAVAPPADCAIAVALDGPYRAKHFAAAARALPALCEPEIEMLDQLSRAWAIGMDRGDRDPARAFEALSRARELDLVFGGVHADEIDVAMRRVVVRAAVELAAENDLENAARAAATAELLGVQDRAIAAVDRWVATRQREQR